METIVHAAQNHVDSIVHLMREKMELTTSQLLGMAEGTSEDHKNVKHRGLSCTKIVFKVYVTHTYIAVLTTLAFLTALPRTAMEKSSSFLKQTVSHCQSSKILSTVL